MAYQDHLDRVHAAVEDSGAAADDGSGIAASWKRSALDFGVDPASNAAPTILTPAEVREHQARARGITLAAREELDQLYRVAGRAGYVALLSNDNGVVVDHRLEEAPSARGGGWGNSVGGVWSEALEGTNGTGTCIIEQRPVTIHTSQHFRARHIGASCAAAPIFGAAGDLIAVLDISSTDPALSEQAHNLAGALVTESARAIEERHFREQFRGDWIVAIAVAAPGGAAFIAVDKDRQIVGLGRTARARFGREGAPLEVGAGFWTQFERDERVFRGKDGEGDYDARLVRIGEGETLPALITPPERPSAIWRNAESAWLHCRPRRGHLTYNHTGVAPPMWSGGLPPRVLARVVEHIEANLSETLELEQLALIAGLSLHHFARAFKKSTGAPPHQYVLQQRLARARDLLADTERPIADIALAAGFADQSHLTRHFRRSFAVSPYAFRQSRR